MPIEIVVFIGGLITFYYLGGMTAVAAGALIVIVYYLLGWGAPIAGAIIRVQERRRLEQQVDDRIRSTGVDHGRSTREASR